MLLGLWREGLSVGVAMDVFHALVAVVAQGSVIVVGEEPDELIGTILGRSKEPQGRAPACALPKYRRLASRSVTRAAIVLARGTFLLLAGGDAQDLLSVVEANIILRHAPLQQAPASALGLLAIAEQHRQVAGGGQVPRTQGARADCSNGQSCGSVIRHHPDVTEDRLKSSTCGWCMPSHIR